MPAARSSATASSAVRVAHHSARSAPVIDRDPRVVAQHGVHAVGAAPVEQLAVDRVADDLVGGHGTRHLDQRHFDQLALAGAVAVLERGDDRERGMGADHRVDRPTRDDRRAALVPGHPRHAGDLLHRLRESRPVAPRSGQAERGHAHHHRVGADAAYDVVVETELLEHSGREVLHDDVGGLDQSPGERAPFFLREVQRDPAFRQVCGVEQPRLLEVLRVL
jgi:hypothetical protein